MINLRKVQEDDENKKLYAVSMRKCRGGGYVYVVRIKTILKEKKSRWYDLEVGPFYDRVPFFKKRRFHTLKAKEAFQNTLEEMCKTEYWEFYSNTTKLFITGLDAGEWENFEMVENAKLYIEYALKKSVSYLEKELI